MPSLAALKRHAEPLLGIAIVVFWLVVTSTTGSSAIKFLSVTRDRVFPPAGSPTFAAAELYHSVFPEGFLYRQFPMEILVETKPGGSASSVISPGVEKLWMHLRRAAACGCSQDQDPDFFTDACMTAPTDPVHTGSQYKCYASSLKGYYDARSSRPRSDTPLPASLGNMTCAAEQVRGQAILDCRPGSITRIDYVAIGREISGHCGSFHAIESASGIEAYNRTDERAEVERVCLGQGLCRLNLKMLNGIQDANREPAEEERAFMAQATCSAEPYDRRGQREPASPLDKERYGMSHEAVARAQWVTEDEQATRMELSMYWRSNKDPYEFAFYNAMRDLVAAYAEANPGFDSNFDVSLTSMRAELMSTATGAVAEIETSEMHMAGFVLLFLLSSTGTPGFSVLLTLTVTVSLSFSILTTFADPGTHAWWQPAARDEAALHASALAAEAECGDLLGSLAHGFCSFNFPSFTPSILISIIVALSVDYTLFLYSRYREETLKGRTNGRAVVLTLTGAGKAVLTSGIILAIAFLGIFLVPFDMVRTLGIGGFVAIVCTIAVHLTLVPGLLLLCGGSCCQRVVRLEAKGCAAASDKIRSRLFPVCMNNSCGARTWRRRNASLQLHDDESATHDVDAAMVAPLSVLANEDGAAADRPTTGFELTERSRSRSRTRSGGRGRGRGNRKAVAAATSALGTSLLARGDNNDDDSAAVAAEERRNGKERRQRKSTRKGKGSCDDACWLAIARLVLSYPVATVAFVSVLSAALGIHGAVSFRTTLDESLLTTRNGEAMATSRKLEQRGLLPGAAMNHILLMRLRPSSPSTPECRDDEEGLNMLASSVLHVNISDQTKGLDQSNVCDVASVVFDICNRPEIAGVPLPALRRQYCARTCGVCGNGDASGLNVDATVLNPVFWAQTSKLLDLVRSAMADSPSYAGGDGVMSTVASPVGFEAITLAPWDRFGTAPVPLRNATAWYHAGGGENKDMMMTDDGDGGFVDEHPEGLPLGARLWRQSFFARTSIDLRSASIRVDLPVRGGDAAAIQYTNKIRAAFADANANLPDSPLHLSDEDQKALGGYTIEYRFFGGSAVLIDTVNGVYATAPAQVLTATVVLVLLLSALAFRSVLIALRLVLTIVVTLAWVFGLAVIVYQDVLAMRGTYWIIPLNCVPIVVGLTLDYDMFLITRIYEYRKKGFSTRESIVRGVRRTGKVITTAGIIMVLAFASLLLSNIVVLRQMGFVLVTASFVDTFIVRSLFVPAVMLVAAEHNWWPGKMPLVTRGDGSAAGVMERMSSSGSGGGGGALSDTESEEEMEEGPGGEEAQAVPAPYVGAEGGGVAAGAV